ncbi:unnamed protein product [Brassicogethes aeneus]|uniref:Uncharacterized protein n=1 Tax=Brassicogethes aeneus TaxID=1431903 RepID=A0A9P0FEZ0_BRAAE|nr:unnamed protein product [Brassicogethes aeneus]
MKLVVLFLIAVTAANAAAFNREKVLVFHVDCVKDSKYLSLVEGLIGKFSDDPKLKEHILWFAQKIGFINQFGKIDANAMESILIELAGSEARVDKVVDNCGKDMNTPTDTAVELMKCLLEIKK